MNNVLSHTSISMFLECSEKFNLHYNERLREVKARSALLFGSAVDVALQYALINHECPVSIERTTKAQFLKKWRWAEINGKREYLRTSENVKWNKDQDWTSLKDVGLLIIDAYFRDIYSNINKVVSFQEKISLKNDNGDEIIGYIDAVLNWKNEGTIIFDFKTSSTAYDDNSAGISPQLTLYKHAISDKYKTNKVGFIVFNKKIGKRNPIVKTQVIIDTIKETKEDEILNNFDTANVLIQKKEYNKNYESCFKYGKCQFYGLCKFGSMDGLAKIEKSN